MVKDQSLKTSSAAVASGTSLTVSNTTHGGGAQDRCSRISVRFIVIVTHRSSSRDAISTKRKIQGRLAEYSLVPNSTVCLITEAWVDERSSTIFYDIDTQYINTRRLVDFHSSANEDMFVHLPSRERQKAEPPWHLCRRWREPSASEHTHTTVVAGRWVLHACHITRLSHNTSTAPSVFDIQIK